MLPLTYPLLFAIGLAVIGYFAGNARARSVVGGDIKKLASLPKQHALNTALSTLLPPFAFVLLLALTTRIGVFTLNPTVFLVVSFALAIVGFGLALLKISENFRARTASERWIMGLLIFASVSYTHLTLPTKA